MNWADGVAWGAVGWLLWSGWQQHWRSLPDPGDLSPSAIAALRGGWKGIIHLLIYDLWKQESLLVTVVEARIQLQALPRLPSGLSFLHKALHVRLREPSSLKALLADRALQKRNREPYLRVWEGLERLGLARGLTTRQAWWIWTVAMAVALWWSETFPVLLGVVALLLVRPWRLSVPTWSGRRFLRSLQNWSAWMRSELDSGRQPGGVPVEMLVALFGLGAVASLMGLPPVAELEALARADGGTESGGGGCGGCGLTDSNDSSGSSGDSSSSDSSSSGCSSCGGGCGGGGD